MSVVDGPRPQQIGTRTDRDGNDSHYCQCFFLGNGVVTLPGSAGDWHIQGACPFRDILREGRLQGRYRWHQSSSRKLVRN